jgi:hypothetical protein
MWGGMMDTEPERKNSSEIRGNQLLKVMSMTAEVEMSVTMNSKRTHTKENTAQRKESKMLQIYGHITKME